MSENGQADSSSLKDLIFLIAQMLVDNPQQVKKGARMPDFLLTEDELNALTAYLSQLY